MRDTPIRITRVPLEILRFQDKYLSRSTHIYQVYTYRRGPWWEEFEKHKIITIFLERFMYRGARIPGTGNNKYLSKFISERILVLWYRSRRV